MDVEHFRTSVRELAEFVHKSGSLDLRFTPAPSALQGIRGHQMVVQRRPTTYQVEVELQSHYASLEVSGRCDGYDPSSNLVEEIKTHRIPVDRIPPNHQSLHWAQLKLYASMLCQSQQLEQIQAAVVYFHVGDQTETRQQQTFDATELLTYFNQTCESYLSWAEERAAHIDRRNQELAALQWPYEDYRDGQYALAVSVFRSAQQRQVQLLEAPTGLGKTMGTLFPMLKAMPDRLDRVFFLTSKNPGKRLALDAAKSLDLKQTQVLELTAKEAACVEPTKACHGESCPLANGFYDRLPKARADAARTQNLDSAGLQSIARSHRICPYFLGQEMAKSSDLVIADCNHVFDSQALLFALATHQNWRVGILLDEAHNLVGRARDMYSVELDQRTLELAIETAPKTLRKAYTPILNLLDLYAADVEGFQVVSELPEPLLLALQGCIQEVTNFLADAPVRHDGPYMDFYFAALSFTRLAEHFDDHSVFTRELNPSVSITRSVTLGIRNLIPAYFLAPRFQFLTAATLFSATLRPFRFQTDLLGIPAGAQQTEIPSPFSSEQIKVHFRPDISTRLNYRKKSLHLVVDCMARAVQDQPGNYLAFFSSYQYLDQVRDSLSQRHPGLTLKAQDRSMTQHERQQFVDSFDEHSNQLGLAVLGGAFGEGIDLPGNRLIGVFITTMGLPMMSELNNLMAQRLEQRFGQETGYEYTYRIPGLQKVIQAAGRLIRTTQDRGQIWLLDERYLDPKNYKLLPEWWKL